MRGSRTDAALHEQDYRQELRELIGLHFPGASIYDPLEIPPSSLGLQRPDRPQRLHAYNRMCRQVDVLVGLPPAGLDGHGHRDVGSPSGGAAVFTITPLRKNWAVKFLSHEIFADLAEFRQAVECGRLAQRMPEVAATANRRPGSDTKVRGQWPRFTKRLVSRRILARYALACGRWCSADSRPARWGAASEWSRRLATVFTPRSVSAPVAVQRDAEAGHARV